MGDNSQVCMARRACNRWRVLNIWLLVHSEASKQAAHNQCCASTLSYSTHASQYTPQVLQPSHLTLSWTSQAQSCCLPTKDADRKPGPHSEEEGAPATTCAGRAAEHFKTEPCEECDTPGWLSLVQGKVPSCRGRDILEPSLRKAVSCPERLFLYWHSGSNTWSIWWVLDPKRSPLCCTRPVPPSLQGAAPACWRCMKHLSCSLSQEKLGSRGSIGGCLEQPLSPGSWLTPKGADARAGGATSSSWRSPAPENKDSCKPHAGQGAGWDGRNHSPAAGGLSGLPASRVFDSRCVPAASSFFGVLAIQASDG